jgi:glycopeptide antibiotics resistance protein
MRLGCFAVTVLFLIYMAVLGFSKNEDVQWLTPFKDDKQLHFAMFFVLTNLFYFTINWKPIGNVAITFSLMLFICIFSEFVQDFLTERVFDIKDIYANVLGSLLGLLFAVLLDLLQWLKIGISSRELTREGSFAV